MAGARRAEAADAAVGPDAGGVAGRWNSYWDERYKLEDHKESPME